MSSEHSNMSPAVSTQLQPDPSAVVAKAVLAAAERLGLTCRHLAQVIGVSEVTLSRLNSGSGIDPASKEGELALLFVRLFRSLDALVGGDDAKGRDWLNTMNTHLGGVPATRICTVVGVVDVVQYLEA